MKVSCRFTSRQVEQSEVLRSTVRNCCETQYEWSIRAREERDSEWDRDVPGQTASYALLCCLLYACVLYIVQLLCSWSAVLASQTGG